MTWTGIEIEAELPEFMCIGCWGAAESGEELVAHIQVCDSWTDVTADRLSVGDHVWIETEDFIGARTLIKPPEPAVGGGIGFECHTSDPDDEFIVVAGEDEVLRAILVAEQDDNDDWDDEDD